MRVYRYRDNGRLRLAVGSDDRVVDPLHTLKPHGLSQSDATLLSDTVAFIQGGQRAMELARRSLDAANAHEVDVASVRLGAPLHPSTILCSGSNYRDHNSEKASSPMAGREPEFFVKTADCLLGPDDGVPHSSLLTQKLDGETELAVVIGKPGRHIPLDRAMEHVFGYTIVNDLTARDLQVRFRADGSAWYELGRGKVFDGSAPMGPCIVTVDELRDPQDLMLRTRVNGDLRQCSSTSGMIFRVADLVHFFSRSMTLRPGIVIITGTPAGTAWSCDPSLGGRWVGGNGIVPAQRYLQVGDVFEAEIEGIGTLRNTIIPDPTESEHLKPQADA